MMIYIGNIAYSMTAEELKELCMPFGNVVSSKVIIDKATGKSKGYGFVEFDNDESALKAIQELNNTQVKGRNIKVNNAFRKNTQTETPKDTEQQNPEA
ncbi:MAG: hypothetical protein PWR03_885 [Tenuifilum sp.]|jgi:RNA recognition motif-containing protein|uniref:RNA-binding protein n=1 Tax=Tenuifilum thalassicum TaxID=2590900 RepID=A0A7D4BE62_9BACT|nr:MULTISPECIES: RNA-binding protein [Tenuifilum]MDI3526702.1 hypothetical protein [Tenuifilum sp.]QKG79758.1 RNA-binding protein [Tenuifilum thalassicum]